MRVPGLAVLPTGPRGPGMLVAVLCRGCTGVDYQCAAKVYRGVRPMNMNSGPETPANFTKATTKHTVRRLMTEQKNRAADGLHRFACLVRNTTKQNQVRGEIENYRNRAAARLDSAATYLRGADFATILRDAGQFSRRPEVLVGGTIVTTLLVARFLKASKRRAPEPWSAAAGRWVEALEKSAQVVSSAADTLKKSAEARGLSPDSVWKKSRGLSSGRTSPSSAIA